MSNNAEILKLLNLQDPHLIISDVEWRTQDSNNECLLFYKIGPLPKDEVLFRERIKSSKFAWLVTNREIDQLPVNCSIISEDKWHKLQKQILDWVYPLPTMKMIGITGTNGKTTTTDLILQLGHLIGKNGLSIGTLGVRTYNHTIQDFGLTSPSYMDLRKFLFRYGQDKDFCVMEASSHALVQERLYEIQFDGAGWPSFSQDHLDYHKTMDEYFRCKCLIFKHLKKHGSLFVPREQTLLFQKLSLVSAQTHATTELKMELPIFFKAQFNKNNLEVAVNLIEDVFNVSVKDRIDQLIPPDGRFFIRPYKTNYIVVDFAHTPDALENICRGIKESFPDYKLKVLFGCGGDRDRTKRPLMGEVVAKFADEIYVTSDNPRSENPDQIIADILVGIKNKKVQSITERPKAVKIAFSELTSREVLLLAGKGHEDYILIHGVKHPYSDIGEVNDFIARNAP